ncbi:hypothetical protein BJ508DRAFT_413188 [Ascobolus immersus RN42]|uniref:Oxidoreductase acuF-like C2H2 type zinc-finger domain-containing protein n=1 Tax=Ascobolus immersus RN42 TaxID=1160509 RepID=A0A3N4ICN7_ASCIM|nr:hypothetical protein BJ508DRAFT_413188 [Ascobolus immersus RN42]
MEDLAIDRELSLSSITTKCHAEFMLLNAAAKYEQPDDDANGVSQYDEILELYHRFGQWVGNLGAMHPPQNSLSLDYRLRNAHVVKNSLYDLLLTLEGNIRTARECINGTRPNRTFNPEECDGYSSSDYESSVNSDSDESDLSNYQTTLSKSHPSGPISELQESIRAIDMRLDSLFRSAMFVRKFSAAERREKAANSKTSRPFDSQADIIHVLDRFEKIRRTQELHVFAMRLGKANARRRQYLKYRKDHESRSAQIQLPSAYAEQNKRELQVTVERVEVLSKTSGSRSFADTLPTLHESEATEFNMKKASEIEAASVISMATTVAETSDLEAPFPPPPTEGRPYKPFICPYCRAVQEITPSTPHKEEQQWRQHVLRDLEPYICTFSSCGLDMFHSQYAWFDHELLNHRSQWGCRKCLGHFYSADQFQSHILVCQLGGDSSISKSLLSRITEQAKRPVDKIRADDCPFCDDWATPPTGFDPKAEVLFVTVNQYRKHVGQHMQKLALFALPRPMIASSLDGSDCALGPDEVGDFHSIGSGYPSQWGANLRSRGWERFAKRRGTLFAISYFIRLIPSLVLSRRTTNESLYELPPELALVNKGSEFLNSSDVDSGKQGSEAGIDEAAQSDHVTHLPKKRYHYVTRIVERVPPGENEATEGGTQLIIPTIIIEGPPRVGYLPPTSNSRLTNLFENLPKDGYIRSLHQSLKSFICRASDPDRFDGYSMYAVKDRLDSHSVTRNLNDFEHSTSEKISRADLLLKELKEQQLTAETCFYIDLKANVTDDSENSHSASQLELACAPKVVVLLDNPLLIDHRVTQILESYDILAKHKEYITFDYLPDSGQVAFNYASDIFWLCCLPRIGKNVTNRDGVLHQLLRLVDYEAGMGNMRDQSYDPTRLGLLVYLLRQLYISLEEWINARKDLDDRLRHAVSERDFASARKIILQYIRDNESENASEPLLKITFFIGVIIFIRDGRSPSVDERICRYLDL